jgi:hypothetical protein
MQRVRHFFAPIHNALTPRAHFVIKRLVHNYTDLALWSFKSKLNREITLMEWRSEGHPLLELAGFPEMQRSAWSGLERLGYEMVRKYRPKVIVELITRLGLSACAMGLALRDVGAGGKLYAVCGWAGDAYVFRTHTDYVYRTFLERRNQLGLDDVIIPLRMTVDEARHQVPGQIDLLHIDGLRTWEAVNHDFESYRPLVRSEGIVLFHDVNTFSLEMRRFWNTISVRYASHLVPYSNGLGIIRVCCAPPQREQAIKGSALRSTVRAETTHKQICPPRYRSHPQQTGLPITRAG